MLIVLNQEIKRQVGAITTVHLIDEATGEILAQDLTVKASDPIRVGRQAINAMLIEAPGAMISADDRFLPGARCQVNFNYKGKPILSHYQFNIFTGGLPSGNVPKN
ncbi:hypothetical protein P9210_03585 [Heyndrickxia coagulans]|uniref:hypothetical protein n=1 Tax=Heyndrickxia coagulans TaxID=1398 RepID=UPI002E9CD778|nr:hypothetical protein [Heyndrickxia coagulans]